MNVRLANKTWLNIDLSYLQGLKDINKVQVSGEKENKNMNLMLNFGVNFGL